MKKLLRSLILSGIVIGGTIISITSAQVISSRNSVNNNVPDYYYANYKFADDWEKIRDIFTKIQSRFELKLNINSYDFVELNTHFKKCFPYLTKDFAAVYEKCTLLSEMLGYGDGNVEEFLGNSCYQVLSKATSRINQSYTVKATAKASSYAGVAPITITFDARGSIDPSSETIPTDNFYWYYRDEKGVDTPMGKGHVINYEFKEAGKFIVHLVVRSSNVDQGILDGEKDLTIDISPKAANIVVYANTRKMSPYTPIKMGISEGAKGIVFDGSATQAKGGRKILSHKWTIVNQAIGFSYSKSGEGSPSYINVPLKGNGEFKVTLTTKDNENNSVSESFYLYMSDPVTVIRQTPSEGNTSTTFTFDGSASYSITNRLNTYIWEIFDENGDKIVMEQGKKMNKIFTKPGNYLVRLTVTDMAGNQNVDIKEVYIESTTPTPQFTATATSKWEYPSEFTLDAGNSTDIDVLNGVDSLEYSWKFSTENVKIVSTEDNNKRIVVQFNETGKHTIKLTVTDQYGKFATISKNIEVKSILRPEIEAIPGAITRGKVMQFKSTVNSPVIKYVRKYGDGKDTDSQYASDVQHTYGMAGVYNVTLTVYDKSGYNTVTERVFIGEIGDPIAAYRVKNSGGFFIQASDTCPGNDNQQEKAYPIDRYASISINPSISVNTKGNSDGLRYVFEPESILGSNQAIIKQELTHQFSQTGCHYVDLTVQDTNIGKQNSTRVRFNVKNALPKINNVTLSFPQYSNNNAIIGFGGTDSSNQSAFDCSGSNNLQVKVTAVGATDPDGSISRLRFYYYNVDDPSRILEYKDTWISTPYVYFPLSRVSGEYKFGVMVYDNDGGMIDTENYLGSNPSVYFPTSCSDSDIPTVTLVTSNQNVQVGSTVTYTVVAKISSNNEDFATKKTFYYDFTGDGVRDLVTKKDSVNYTFTEPYEDGVVPKVAVEYRGKLGKGEGARILVKNGIKPILLFNSYKNTVLFRDLSIGVFQQRKICFETDECKLGNNKYQRTHIVTTGITELTGGTITPITKNDSFLRKYSDFGLHNVSLYLKSRYGNEDLSEIIVKTTSDNSNGLIAPGINMITIPETTFTNANPEIFLSKNMNNTLLMYMSNETGDTCYVDTDISKDSDGDGKADNDMDIVCNTMAKIVYQPNYESAIGRVYFVNDGKLTFKNFYVSFEGYILELDEEKLDIYKDITVLINGIEDISVSNTDLKSSLDILRKNLNNIMVVSPMVVSIRDQINEGGIKIDKNQTDLLNSVLDRLSNRDTIISVGKNEYEKNKEEIMAILPASFKSVIEGLFADFEESNYDLEGKASALQNIWDTIIQRGKDDGGIDNNDIVMVVQPAFCNIFEYYDISRFSNVCSPDIITETWSNVTKTQMANTNTSSSGLPGWLKIIIIVLVGGLLVMGGVIVFFSIKARLSSKEDEEE